VHVLGIQVITSALEKVFQRDLLCLLCFTWVVGCCFFFFYFYCNDYKSIPGFETLGLTAGLWPLLSEVPKAAVAQGEHLLQKYLNRRKR